MEDCAIENDRSSGATRWSSTARSSEPRLIAAGSIVSVNAKIPPETVIAGVPAVGEEQLEGERPPWVEDAARYVALARTYLGHGIGDPEVQESIETTS